jgi:hypothetical protein
MLKTISLSKIKDNPFRDKKINPMDEKRIEELVESIHSTDFWKGVYGREKNGIVEIAFGHHRIDAARKSGLKEIPIEIMEFDEKDMLMRMARENLRGELLTCLEIVSAAVKAYGAGIILLEEPSKDTRKSVLRYAPSFIPGKGPRTTGVQRPYTADTLARFLGGVYVKTVTDNNPFGRQRATESVIAALNVLEMEEQKIPGFSEQVLRRSDEEKDEGEYSYLGAKKIIKIVSAIKSRDKEEEKHKKAERKAEQEAIDAKRKIEAEAKERAKKLAEEKQKSIEAEAQARVEEDKRKVAREKERRENLEQQAAEKAVIDKIKISAIDAKVAADKKKIEESRKEQEYALVRRDVETFLNRLETTQAALLDNIKSLVKRNPTLKDRERLWESLRSFSDWAGGWAAAQFVGSGVPKQLLKGGKLGPSKRK